MSNWRDSILDNFVPHISKLTLVADPDALLTEEKLVLELKNRGFDLIEFNDSIEFRYAYESRYRANRDRENPDIAVVLRFQDPELNTLPYDLLNTGRKLTFSLGGLFPRLSYPVIEQLDRSLLDALFEAQEENLKKASQNRLGDKASMDFILLHVFGIAEELINTGTDLLRTLLRLHYNKLKIPEVLCTRLVDVLKARGSFHTWPLEELIPDEEAFFEFLQERWPVFLEERFSGKGIYEKSSGKEFKYPGPEVLPFDHQDIRVYIDNLFVEGKLTPVQKPGIDVEANSWLQSGITETKPGYEEVRINRLFDLVEKSLPGPEARHQAWLEFAMNWAKLGALIHTIAQENERERFQKISSNLNQVFPEWLSGHYTGLFNLPPTNPAMLHHIPRRMAREMEDEPGTRIALIVMDGLSLDQWFTLRTILTEQDSRLLIRDSAVFAWIPTLTSVSRQAIFAGKPPLYYPLSINTTNKEANLWSQFWADFGLSRQDVAYQRGLREGKPADVLEGVLNPDRTKVVGLVVDMVDRIMHGMCQGAAGMHNQIEQWGRNGYLSSLISYLLGQDYQVWLTSDHGNIECRGKGRPAEGALAETRGERVRIYPTPELRSSVASSFTFAHEWQPVGLPPNYFPLVAGGSDAFIKEGEMIVGHGGVSIEEVIVPFVKLERRTR